MNRIFLVLLVILGGVLLAIPAMAQMPPGSGGAFHGRMGPRWGGPGAMCGGPFWQDPDIAKALNLSKDQIDKLEKIHTDHQRAMIDAQANAKKAFIDYMIVYKDDRLDEKKAKAAADSYYQAKKMVTYKKIEMRAAVDNVLTADQSKKLRELMPQRCREERGGHHPYPEQDEDTEE